MNKPEQISEGVNYSRVLSLLRLCQATVVRNSTPVDKSVPKTMMRYMEEETEKYLSNSRGINRLSGSIPRCLATFEKSTSVWGEVESIAWFASGDNISEVLQAWSNPEHSDVEAKLKACLLGALVGDNFICLKMALNHLQYLGKYYSCNYREKVLQWIQSSSQYLSMLKLTQLCLMSEDLGKEEAWDAPGKNIRVYSLLKAKAAEEAFPDDPAVQSKLVSMPHYSCSVGHAIAAAAIREGGKDTISWLIYYGVDLTHYYICACLLLDRTDMIPTELYHLASELREESVHWIWANCPVQSLDWMLLHSGNAKNHFATVCVVVGTVAKLELLFNRGIMLTEWQVQHAARYCTPQLFSQAVRCSRSWQPVWCYRVSRWNILYSTQMEAMINVLIDGARLPNDLNNVHAMPENFRIRNKLLARSGNQPRTRWPDNQFIYD